MPTLGILGDKPSASTGFATVCRNYARELSRWFDVIYFGRFGQDKEFAEYADVYEDEPFLYVPTVGGVWDRELVIRLLKHYNEVQYIFSEDDFFSAAGMVHACNFWDKPFHLHSPIDSLPLPDEAFTDIFSSCDKIYIPNRSYEIYDGKKRLTSSSARTIKRAGPVLKSVYLPHGCDSSIFKPMKVNREDEFTFVWTGRIEERKNPRAFVLAAEKVCKTLGDKNPVRFFMRSDWLTPNGRKFLQYIYSKNLPFYMDQMTDCPHSDMSKVYNMGDVYVNTSKAGGCEMSILEAGACCIPSLATDWTFMNENIINEKNGFVIPTEGFCHPPKNHPQIASTRIWGDISVNKLVERMIWCVNNVDYVKHMGRWARANVVKNYRWRDMAEVLRDEILESYEG